MADTPVFFLHAAIAAVLAAGMLFLPLRRMLAGIVVAACVALSAAWLAGVVLVPMAPPPIAVVLRQLVVLTFMLGPWLVGAAVVATLDAARQRRDSARTAPRLAAGLAIYIALNFFGFEIGKALHDAEMRQFFQASGLPLWSMYAVMAVETACAIALLFPRLRHLGAGVLVLMMCGAIATHAHNGDPFSDSLDALRMLLMSACILVLWKARRASALSPPRPLR
jgi:uncharacterized membrane protein YphA (DoxX/SURF4 family)